MALTTTLNEWLLCRVILAKDVNVVPVKEQPLGTIGHANDKAKCIFCGKKFSAQANRVRNHIAGGGVGGKEAGVEKCPGLSKRRESESVDDYTARQEAFKKAVELCKEANGVAAAKNDTKRRFFFTFFSHASALYDAVSSKKTGLY